MGNVELKAWRGLLFAIVLVTAGLTVRAQQSRAIAATAADEAPAMSALAPTRHPPVPRDVSQLWLAPVKSGTYRTVANANLEAAIKMVGRGEYSKALNILNQPSVREGTLANYAAYYSGIAQLELARNDDALKTFKSLRERAPFGYLFEAAALGEARAYEAQNDYVSAMRVYELLLRDTLMRPDEVYMRLGFAARAAHERNKAADAFGRVYYEFALSERAEEAGAQLVSLDLEPPRTGGARYKLDLGRAERLFAVKQYGPAHAAFDALRSRAADEDRELIALRLAESDYFLKRTRAAREALRPFLARASRQGEATYFYAIASRDLRDDATYLRLSREIVDKFPTESWAEESLNALGSYYIRKDDDDRADAAFRELYQKYPKGAYGDRAAWKSGWRSYRQGRYAETIRFFERAALDYPRSDYRPSWLYWAGRAHERLNAKAAAEDRYLLVAADYLNSYYGRLAARRLGRDGVARATAAYRTGAADLSFTQEPPPNAPTIRALLEAEMYDDAVNELKYAQRVWSDSPTIQATLAWTGQQQAIGKKGTEQFQLLRGGITQMRRAYPQFMAAGGEDLPREVLAVIFPLAYWDLIRTHSAANGLDPYFVAALMAQESTFVPDIRSHANAYGLMQLLPSTARIYARRLNLRYSSSLLTRPESNVRMGTRHFADVLKDFGGEHYLALSAYNAGPSPVRRWMAERPGLEVEEFIDDIPYPETQNYVKRILGTTEDYRRLYGS